MSVGDLLGGGLRRTDQSDKRFSVDDDLVEQGAGQVEKQPKSAARHRPCDLDDGVDFAVPGRVGNGHPRDLVKVTAKPLVVEDIQRGAARRAGA